MSNKTLLDRLKKRECRDSTMMVADHPLVFQSAKGSIITDCEGNEYIDLCAGFGSLPLGHNHSSFTKIAYSRTMPQPPITHGMGDVYPSISKVEFLETFHKYIPQSLAKSTLSLSGSQAVEIAIKSAILSTKCSGFLALEDGYHGVDMGALPFTFRSDFKQNFQDLLPNKNVVFIKPECSMNEIKKAIHVLQSRNLKIAGCICEPIQGRAGVRALSFEWLWELRNTIKAEGGLFILDEIFTGMGRIGTWSSSHRLLPDLALFGKAVGGGLPLSICSGTDEVMNCWPDNEEAIHTGTFFGHPLACEVGKATIQEIESQGLVERSRALGERAKDHLVRSICQKNILSIKGKGLMLCIEFDRSQKGAKLMHLLRNKKIIALASGPGGQSLTLSPALNIHEDLLFEGLDKVIDSINS